MNKIPRPYDIKKDSSRAIYRKVYEALWHVGRRSDAKNFDVRVRNLDSSSEGEAKLIMMQAASKYVD